jgi:uncharacterized protein YjlB
MKWIKTGVLAGALMLSHGAVVEGHDRLPSEVHGESLPEDANVSREKEIIEADLAYWRNELKTHLFWHRHYTNVSNSLKTKNKGQAASRRRTAERHRRLAKKARDQVKYLEEELGRNQYSR